jgi:hypothetical protein
MDEAEIDLMLLLYSELAARLIVERTLYDGTDPRVAD